MKKSEVCTCEHAINKLLEYGLIQEAGRLDAPGRPILFGTTEEFLRRFSIQSIEDLPSMQPEQVETFKEETGNGNLNRYSVFIETEEQLEAVFSFLNQKEELYGQGTQRIGRIALDFRLFVTGFSDTHVRDRIDFWRKSGVELYLVFPHIFRENAQEWFGRQFENFNQLLIDGVVIRNFEVFLFT